MLNVQNEIEKYKNKTEICFLIIPAVPQQFQLSILRKILLNSIYE